MSYKFKRSCQWAVIKLVDFNPSCLLSTLKDGWQKISDNSFAYMKLTQTGLFVLIAIRFFK